MGRGGDREWQGGDWERFMDVFIQGLPMSSLRIILSWSAFILTNPFHFSLPEWPIALPPQITMVSSTSLCSGCMMTEIRGCFT